MVQSTYNTMKKREFLKAAGLLGAGALMGKSVLFASSSSVDLEPTDGPAGYGNEFTIPELGYAFTALEPHIDALTMEIHYMKHHAAYVANLNKAVANDVQFQNKDIDTVLTLVTGTQAAIRNNAGGHWNHSMFWKWIRPGGSKLPGGALELALNNSFGNFEEFKKQFSESAKNRFGSGWAWLCLGEDKKLFVCSSPNQDNPLMTNISEQKGLPILGLDVWEHAYYLKHQNKRADYINSFFEIVNWDQVTAMYLAAMH